MRSKRRRIKSKKKKKKKKMRKRENGEKMVKERLNLSERLKRNKLQERRRGCIH